MTRKRGRLSHIDSINADLERNETPSALRVCLPNRLKALGYSRNVFVLTDGQVSNLDQITNLIARNARDTRVFALGIGDQVSHALVKGLAKVRERRTLDTSLQEIEWSP